MSEHKKTVLVVDDVPDEILVLKEILQDEYVVKAATGGEDALAIVAAQAPDLILLDVMMPGMDGFEVCRHLKKDSSGSTIPVIFLTAKVRSADESEGLRLGAVDYLRKPVEPDILKSRIKAQLERKDEILRISEVRYRRLFENSKAGILIADMETGRTIDVNPALVGLLGCTQELFLDANLWEVEPLKDIVGERERLPLLAKGEYVSHKDRPIRTCDGREIHVETMFNSYEVEGREVLQLSVRDISDLVAAENERDKLSARLSHYLATSPTITYSLILRDGTVHWQWVSGNIGRILGYTGEEALAPDWWFRNISSADRLGAMGLVSDLVEKETASREYRFARKDRSQVWLHDEMRLVGAHGRDYEIVGTLTDISERKKIEAEILLKSAALESTANAVYITDRDGFIRWANRAYEALSGHSVEESLGKNPRSLVKSGVHDAAFYRGMWGTILEGKVWSGDVVNRRKDGSLFTESLTITPVLDEARYVSHFIAVAIDVTERERGRERLEAALREKSVLLREIHHRVNNNMQVLTSLMNLSIAKAADEEVREGLREVSRRVLSMALVHEQFYGSDDLSRIDFGVYLNRLAEGLMIEFPEAPAMTDAACVTGTVYLHLEQAVPAALVVSELFVNALKFAYPEGRKRGRIRLSLRSLPGGRLEVEVADSGVGLPPGLDPASAQSMGMTLIRALSKQLDGSIQFRKGNGTTAILGFAAQDGAAAGTGDHSLGGHDHVR